MVRCWLRIQGSVAGAAGDVLPESRRLSMNKERC